MFFIGMNVYILKKVGGFAVKKGKIICYKFNLEWHRTLLFGEFL